MAQVPRTLPPAALTTVQAGRLPGSPRAVATLDTTPVEELSPQGGVSFNSSLLFQDEETNNQQHPQGQTGKGMIEYAGGSQTFATIFEEVNPSGSDDEEAPVRARSYSGYVARAIDIYENNIRIINGSNNQRGGSLSMNL